MDTPVRATPRQEVDVSGTFLEPPPGLDPDCQLFLGDPHLRTTSTLYRLWMPCASAVALCVGSIAANIASKRPFRAGAYRHIVGFFTGGTIGEVAWRWKQKVQSERDIQYYHYMVLHPEDFQAPERKKWGEVLKPWIPMR